MLEDVYVKPSFPGKKFPGELAIHKNGLRYLNQIKGEEQKIGTSHINIIRYYFR